MDDMAESGNGFPVVLDPYVQQGRMFLFNAAQNLIQYGRVLVEAKPLVPRGQFEKWVQTSFNMSERTAQGYMAVWRRFGSNAMLQDVQFSNLQKMLALPEGSEAQFAKDNDLQAMTAREVEQAVRQVREEELRKRNLAIAEVDKERSARTKAENRLKELEAKAKEPNRDLIAVAAEKDAEIRRLQRLADMANQERNEANARLEAAQEDLREVENALAENQQEYNRMQADLLNALSTIARGDAERCVSEQFTIEDFSTAVRGFLGSVTQMPYMGEVFCQMVDQREYRQWDILLQAVEDWAVKSRRAMKNTISEGACIDG